MLIRTKNIIITICFKKNVDMIKINIMYYDRIDVSGGIDVNKTNKSKESDVCHYCYFLDKSFKFLTYVCNGCHDL